MRSSAAMVSAQCCAPFARPSDQASGGTPTFARYRLCSARITVLLIFTGAAMAGPEHSATAANATAAKFILDIRNALHTGYAGSFIIGTSVTGWYPSRSLWGDSTHLGEA